MAKPKNKQKNEVEFYRSKVRELQKYINQLERKLTRYERTQHLIDDAHEALMEVEQVISAISEEVKPNRENPCDKCDTGELVPKIELNDKYICECLNCGNRKTIKKE